MHFFGWFSSTNAKKWEAELQTLRNNNARLTTALQESASNVDEWSRQLQMYKDENSQLRLQVIGHIWWSVYNFLQPKNYEKYFTPMPYGSTPIGMSRNHNGTLRWFSTYIDRRWMVFPVSSCIHVECFASFCQSINQSKHISIAPYVASESEAHISVTVQKTTQDRTIRAFIPAILANSSLHHCDLTFLFRDLEVFGFTSR